MRGVVAGLVVVALAAACVFMFMGKDEKPVEKVEKAPTAIKEVKHAAASVYREPQKDTNAVAAVRKERAEKLKKMTSLERFDYMVAELQKKPFDLNPGTNETFRTVTEEMVSEIFSTRLGDTPPQLPRIPFRDEVHMAEILIAANPVSNGDDDETAEKKAIVEAVKKEMREYLKQGGDIAGFIDYYQDQLEQANNEWKDSQKSVTKVLRDDPDIAADYIKEVNKRLKDKGIKPVNIPKKIRDELGLDDE